jgi:sterol-4alpha-carboxylate 3-dehydrogenase (decarboxylating)
MAAFDPVLVIGGCGGLGFHIVTQLLQSGEAANITVLDIDHERNRVEDVNYIKGSVTSHGNVSIFHVASPYIMHQSATPKLFEEINVSGTQNL